MNQKPRSLPVLLLDVDGTLADHERRIREAGPEPDRVKNPEEHDAWIARVQSDESLALDPVIPLMPFLVQRLSSHMNIVYLTARTNEHVEVTLRWLQSKGFPTNCELLMRDPSDKRTTAAYKDSAVKHVKEVYRTNKIIAIDDDLTGELHAVYAGHGVTFLKSMYCIAPSSQTEIETERERMLKEFKLGAG